ncbi:hypothetical protein LCGC14_2359270 [marine sediment metagenome]|uniref:Uncharacterized protein n=1 Tax=marine sediment metagenome TaxID=412755 RepID=A0A0F9EJJ5_9ZZZZ
MFRVMVSGGIIKDFKIREEAVSFLIKRRGELRKMKGIEGETLEVSIHECGHGVGKPCINWERFTK